MKRVAIIGCGGADKSTLTRKMGELRVHHLDQLYWRTGCKERVLIEKSRICGNWCNQHKVNRDRCGKLFS